MKKRQTRERKIKPQILSNLKKGELEDSPKYRFGCKEGCELEFNNDIEVTEEKKGYCIYFCGVRRSK